MKDEIIIYQPNEQSVTLEVRIEEDTVWLNQAQMAELNKFFIFVQRQQNT
jgi:hypothetical protein